MNTKTTKSISISKLKALMMVVSRLNEVVLAQKFVCRRQHKKFSSTTKITGIARAHLYNVKYFLDRCPKEAIDLFDCSASQLFSNMRIFNVYRVIEACSYYLYLDGLENTGK